jgi:hypothetical protein
MKLTINASWYFTIWEAVGAPVYWFLPSEGNKFEKIRTFQIVHIKNN